MSRIFISYRRGDSAGHTGRLLDSLEARFGSENLFRDIEDLEVGVDFPDALERALAECDVMLVMIGREWASAAGPKGRRLDLPDDFVRMEVASALARANVTVIPVLVNEGGIPEAEDLPEDLRPLTRKNAIELSDTRWDYDVSRLSETLGRLLDLPDGNAAPEPPTPKSEGGHGLRNLALAAMAIVAVVVGLALFSGPDPEVTTGGISGGDTHDAGGFAVGAGLPTDATEIIGGDAYQALVEVCLQQPGWQWSCDVPAIPDIEPFLDGPCMCFGRILMHLETGLFRCEELSDECGGVSFMKTLGYPPEPDWYEDVTP